MEMRSPVNGSRPTTSIGRPTRSAISPYGTGLDRAGESRLRFHDLRHTFASLLVAEGLNIVYVSRQLGHATPSFTLNVYLHLFDRAEHGRRAADALEAGFSSVLSP
jgi:integrase